MIGNGSVSISAQLEGENFLLRNCELAVPNEGHIAYTPEVYPNPFLENLKDLGFKKLSVYLTEQDNKLDLIFSSDNKSNKLRKKTNFRFTIKEPLSKFIRSSIFKMPDIVKDEKEAF